MNSGLGQIRGSSIFRIVLLVLPLTGYLSALTAGRLAAPSIIWPPVGSMTYFAAGASSTLIWIIGGTSSYIRTLQNRRKAFFAGALTAFGVLILYAWLLSSYVVCLDTPFNGRQCRTVGSQRTTIANQCSPADSDKDLLHCSGLEDGDIETVWTPSSVHRTRLLLFVTYTLVLGVLNFTTALSPKQNKLKLA